VVEKLPVLLDSEGSDSCMKNTWRLVTGGVPLRISARRVCLHFSPSSRSVIQVFISASSWMLPDCEGTIDVLETRAD